MQLYSETKRARSGRLPGGGGEGLMAEAQAVCVAVGGGVAPVGLAVLAPRHAVRAVHAAAAAARRLIELPGK